MEVVANRLYPVELPCAPIKPNATEHAASAKAAYPLDQIKVHQEMMHNKHASQTQRLEVHLFLFFAGAVFIA